MLLLLLIFHSYFPETNLNLPKDDKLIAMCRGLWNKVSYFTNNHSEYLSLRTKAEHGEQRTKLKPIDGEVM